MVKSLEKQRVSKKMKSHVAVWSIDYMSWIVCFYKENTWKPKFKVHGIHFCLPLRCFNCYDDEHLCPLKFIR